MRAIVTGGAGFIGSHLVDALVERGDEVFVIDNLSTGRRENVNTKAKLFEFDISRVYLKDDASQIFKYIDYIFHLAALPKVQFSVEYPAETNTVNIGGTLNVIALAVLLNVRRLIYSSSSSIYGDQLSLPLREDMPANPMSPYALQKFTAEKYCQLFCQNMPNRLNGAVCLRYFNVYGPRQSGGGSYPSAIGNFLKNKKSGTVSVVYGGGQTRDFTWVGDVARANILAAESDKVGKGEVINIGGGANYSIDRLSEIIGGIYVCRPARTGEPPHTLADISRAKELLGWEPKVTLEEGIAKLKKLNGLM